MAASTTAHERFVQRWGETWMCPHCPTTCQLRFESQQWISKQLRHFDKQGTTSDYVPSCKSCRKQQQPAAPAAPRVLKISPTPPQPPEPAAAGAEEVEGADEAERVDARQWLLLWELVSAAAICVVYGDYQAILRTHRKSGSEALAMLRDPTGVTVFYYSSLDGAWQEATRQDKNDRLCTLYTWSGVFADVMEEVPFALSYF